MCLHADTHSAVTTRRAGAPSAVTNRVIETPINARPTLKGHSRPPLATAFTVLVEQQKASNPLSWQCVVSHSLAILEVALHSNNVDL